MISKKVLSEIVSKYSLGGHVEKVKGVVNEKDKVAIEFINDSKTLVGQVYYNNNTIIFIYYPLNFFYVAS